MSEEWRGGLRFIGGLALTLLVLTVWAFAVVVTARHMLKWERCRPCACATVLHGG